MILGMSLSAFTTLHVVISLVAIVVGLAVVFGMFGGHAMAHWTALFLLATILTSVTGFFFPAAKLLPSHIVGLISLAVLGVALFALYSRRLAGSWRWVYVVTAVLALYFNVFVLVAQGFMKVPALNALAPTQAEPPFAIAQGVVMLLFVVFGVIAVRKFYPERLRAA